MGVMICLGYGGLCSPSAQSSLLRNIMFCVSILLHNTFKHFFEHTYEQNPTEQRNQMNIFS